MTVSLEVSQRWEYDNPIPRFSTAKPSGEVEKAVVDYFVQVSPENKSCIDRGISTGDNPDLHIHTSSAVSAKSRDGESSNQSWNVSRTLQQYKTERMGSEFYGFLHLAPEIRQIIYEYVLVQGHVPVPNRGYSQRTIQYWEGNDGQPYTRYQDLWYKHKTTKSNFKWVGMPAPRHEKIENEAKKPLGLILGVSRAIHTEAVQVFYGLNHLIFPFNPGTGLLSWGRDAPELQYVRLMRDVSYTFDMREAESYKDNNNLYYDRRLKKTIDNGDLSPVEAMQLLHDQRTFKLELDWADRINLIKQMALQRLTLSFEEAYCPVGCCRKVAWLLDRLLHSGPLPGFDAGDETHVYSSTGWVVHPPLVVDVMGWVSEREKKIIEGKLKQLADGAAIGINFVEPVTVSSESDDSDDEEDDDIDHEQEQQL